MSELDNLKSLIADAHKEAIEMKDSFCNPRGMLWWKSNLHEWEKWDSHLVKKEHGGTPKENILGYYYKRKCKHCGTEQFKYMRIK